MSKDQKVHHRQYGPTIARESEIMAVNLRGYTQLYWIFISFWDCSYRISVNCGLWPSNWIQNNRQIFCFYSRFSSFKARAQSFEQFRFLGNQSTVYFTHLDKSNYTKLKPCFFSWTDFVKLKCHTKVTLKSWREKLILGTKKREQRIDSWPVADSTIIKLY